MKNNSLSIITLLSLNMKVAYFNYLPLEYGGGTAKYFIETASNMKKRYPDLDISIVTFSKELAKIILHLYSIYFLNYEIAKLEYNESYSETENMIKDVRYFKIHSISELKSLLNKQDIVYAKNDIFEAFIIKCIVGIKNIRRLIYGFHTPLYYPQAPSFQSKVHNYIYHPRVYKYFLNGAYKYHVLNDFEKNLLTNKFGFRNVCKIYNPFDFTDFENKARRNKYRFLWKKTNLNILWAGRLTEQKGVDDLIQIISRVNNTSKISNKIVWNIVGVGELQKKIYLLEKRWKNINYFGYIKNDYMASIYKNNDIFLSTSKWENFPYTILEAQTFGLPVFSYDIPGCNELIASNVNGLLISDLKSYINELTRFISNPKFERRKIIKYIHSKINTEEIYKKIYTLFVK